MKFETIFPHQTAFCPTLPSPYVEVVIYLHGLFFGLSCLEHCSTEAEGLPHVTSVPVWVPVGAVVPRYLLAYILTPSLSLYY